MDSFSRITVSANLRFVFSMEYAAFIERYCTRNVLVAFAYGVKISMPQVEQAQ